VNYKEQGCFKAGNLQQIKLSEELCDLKTKVQDAYERAAGAGSIRAGDSPGGIRINSEEIGILTALEKDLIASQALKFIVHAGQGTHDVTTKGIRITTVENDDEREGLRGQGKAVAAEELPKYHVIGGYAGRLCTEADYKVHGDIL
jgi:hypothetical protein